MRIESPDTDAVGGIVDLWVELARDQRQHGSHLDAGSNRERVLETVVQRVVVGGVRLAVAEDETVLGFVTFSVESDGFERDVTRGTIENLYVRPEHRGDGIGSELLAVAERELEEKGVAAIKLEVMAANERARRFYERHGYDIHRIVLEKATESDTHSKEDE